MSFQKKAGQPAPKKLCAVIAVVIFCVGDVFADASKAPNPLDEEQEILIIEEDAPASAAAEDDEIRMIDEEETLVIEGEDADVDDTGQILSEASSPERTDAAGWSVLPEISVSESLVLKVEDLWAEYGRFVKSDSAADNQGYLHGLVSAAWQPEGSWEARLSGRVDSYHQNGGRSANDTELDYDESFLRYRGDSYRLTAGAQKVIWGRIDEVPPTDRMSVPDFSRGVLDYLPDRRRAAPVMRFEGFKWDNKLDLVWLPTFRRAELPDQDSVWYPVNRDKGEIIGLETNNAQSAAIKAAPLKNDAPNTQGGFGVRLNGAVDVLDYAVTVQRVRQATPYFRFNQSGVLEAEYPRSWVYGGDMAVDAWGATWRFEAAWISDTPVTRRSKGYTTTESINWAAGAELYPGDGDDRISIQLIGTNLVDAPDNMIDRESIYTLNGEAEILFSHHRWRLKNRFFLGLDKRDVYINPEVAFIAWEPHELYLAGHYFEGDSGTVGDFYEDDSLVTVGWRARF